MKMENIESNVMQSEALDGPANAAEGFDFDQIEAISSTKSSERKAEKELAKANDDASAEPKEKAEKKAPVKKEEADAEQKMDADGQAKPVGKSFKAIGPDGKPLEINGQTKFTLKVDCKDTEVSFEELSSNFAGKVPWKKRYDELAQEKKSFYTERDTVNRTIGSIAERAKAGKPIEALSELFTAMGADPVAGVKALIADIQKAAPALFNQATSEDQERFSKDLELSVHKAVNGISAERSQAQKEKEELDGFIQGELQKNGMEMPEFYAAYEELIAQKGEGAITAQTTIDFALDRRAEKQVEEALVVANVPDEKITPKLLKVMAKHVREGRELAEVVDATMDVMGLKKSTKSASGSAPAKSALARKVTGDGGGGNSKTLSTNTEAFSFDEL